MFPLMVSRLFLTKRNKLCFISTYLTNSIYCWFLLKVMQHDFSFVCFSPFPLFKIINLYCFLLYEYAPFNLFSPFCNSASQKEKLWLNYICSTQRWFKISSVRNLSIYRDGVKLFSAAWKNSIIPLCLFFTLYEYNIGCVNIYVNIIALLALSLSCDAMIAIIGIFGAQGAVNL